MGYGDTVIAVLIAAIESTRGTLISAMLAVGEKSCRRAVSSARASRLRSQLLLLKVSTTNATEYFVAISEVGVWRAIHTRARHELMVVYRQKCAKVIRHSRNPRRYTK